MGAVAFWRAALAVKAMGEKVCREKSLFKAKQQIADN
jgi:hypothetical protein